MNFKRDYLEPGLAIEDKLKKLLEEEGFSVVKAENKFAPHDLILNKTIRLEVESTQSSSNIGRRWAIAGKITKEHFPYGLSVAGRKFKNGANGGYDYFIKLSPNFFESKSFWAGSCAVIQEFALPTSYANTAGHLRVTNSEFFSIPHELKHAEFFIDNWEQFINHIKETK